MALRRQLLPLFALFCLCPLSLYSQPSSFGQPTYPTYFSTIEEDANDFNLDFAADMGLVHEVIRLEGFDQVEAPLSSPRVVNVENYGARSDGSDASKAFLRAWEDACENAPSIFVVPKKKKYLLKPITFSGPCKSNVKVMIQGTLLASTKLSDWEGENGAQWILFSNVGHLNVGGGGTLNGNGATWWKRSCKIDKSRPCTDAPTALLFHSCKNLVVNNLKVKDSPQIQVSFQKCSNVQASSLMITAPGNSPNTDGIHVTSTQRITIKNCVIGTGDDCISIVSGSKNVKATGITCGPGHGISIGSLGKGKSEAHVSQVSVDGAKLIGTTNGVRIKTWQGGSGKANNIQFSNIIMENVTNPIIIDQNYCDSKKPCQEQDSAVAVSNVVYKNIKGTSASEVAVKFDCSESVSCHGIQLQSINLVGVGGKTVKSKCANVKGSTKGAIVPPACF